MTNLYITNASIVLEQSIITDGFVQVAEGIIKSVGKMADCPPIHAMEKVIQCTGDQYVIPGMINLHVHGGGGYDFMDAKEEAFERIALAFAKEGTTSYLATTMTDSVSKIKEVLKSLASYQENKAGVPELLGIHLEGPFINREQKGAQKEEAIVSPDVETFKEWQKLSGDKIKIVTFAPELDKNLELLAELKKSGVIGSMGHTDASYDESVHAIDHGITQATHLFNGMRGIHHREPGVVGAALLHEDVYVEVIPDGAHFHPDLLKLVLRMKGLDRMLAITDGIRATGMPDGDYDLGGQQVRVQNGKCLLSTGASLAGSIVTMNKARLNVANWLGLSINEQIKITSMNQAERLGIWDRKGSIQAGKDADLLVLSKDGEIDWTICRGAIAYHRGEE